MAVIKLGVITALCFPLFSYIYSVEYGRVTDKVRGHDDASKYFHLKL